MDNKASITALMTAEEYAAVSRGLYAEAGVSDL